MKSNESAMRKLLLSFFACVFCLVLSAQQSPKYVFFFIGDGMGVNQVNGTEAYMAALEGRIGTKPLRFASFPHVALVTTHSASNGITNSSAGGTALASGRKTYNNAIGLLPDSITPLTTIADWAKESGAAVGITTSVSVDHATPAAFYAHQKHRKMYYEIALDLLRSEFDFFAGSDFLMPTSKDGKNNVYHLAEKAGFVVARGLDDYATKKNSLRPMILLQSQAASQEEKSCLRYAIDRRPGDLTLSDLTRATIEQLMQKNAAQFFCMIEGGKIDWACHANDAATVFKEIIDMDEAVGVALDFYEKHPNETLIIVTADHETGGMALGSENYVQRSEYLAYQKMSSYEYSARLKALRKEKGESFTFDFIKQDLGTYFGLWTKIAVSERDEKKLRNAFDNLVAGRDPAAETTEATEIELAALAKKILNQSAYIGWTTKVHTNGYVPVFAIGAGAEQFSGRIDNTDIPKIIGRVAGYKMPSDFQ